MREPTHQERKLFGDLAPDVVVLRESGVIVAPFKGLYRVDNDEMTDSGVRALAEKKRKLLAAKPSIKTRAPVRTKEPAGDCACGRAEGHLGRCWVRRGLDGPPGSGLIEAAATAPPAEPSPPPAPTPAAPTQSERIPDDIIARLDRLERNDEELKRLLRLAVQGRLASLEVQSEALREIETELSPTGAG